MASWNLFAASQKFPIASRKLPEDLIRLYLPGRLPKAFCSFREVSCRFRGATGNPEAAGIFLEASCRFRETTESFPEAIGSFRSAAGWFRKLQKASGKLPVAFRKTHRKFQASFREAAGSNHACSKRLMRCIKTRLARASTRRRT